MRYLVTGGAGFIGFAAELDTQMIIAKNLRYTNKDQFIGRDSELQELVRMITGLAYKLSCGCLLPITQNGKRIT
ncbi:MAG: hypothetical protein PHY48_06935 [Candidatus Cloacimonetes bacterium]|nr:hypothetical protein [Candidatus Cloacimonadota bacterium]